MKTFAKASKHFEPQIPYHNHPTKKLSRVLLGVFYKCMNPETFYVYPRKIRIHKQYCSSFEFNIFKFGTDSSGKRRDSRFHIGASAAQA